MSILEIGMCGIIAVTIVVVGVIAWASRSTGTWVA